MALLDGREEIVADVADADDDLRAYVASELVRLMEDVRFDDGIAGNLDPDPGSQARIDEIVMPRIRALLGAPGTP